MAKGGAWQRGACVAKGGMHGKGGACVAKGACMARGHAWYACPPFYEIQPVNARAVCILLECILVLFLFRFLVEFDEFYRIIKLSMDSEQHYSWIP